MTRRFSGSVSERIFRFSSTIAKGLALLSLTASCGGNVADQSEQEGTAVGSVSQALGPAPDTNCTAQSCNGHDYWFCSNSRTWSTARGKCETAGLNLARIDSAAENEFVRSKISI